MQEDKVIWKEIEEVIWLFYPKQEDIRSKRRSLKMGSKLESIYFIDVLLLCVHISVSLKYASLLFNAYDFVTKSKISIVSFQDSQETKSKNLILNKTTIYN